VTEKNETHIAHEILSLLALYRMCSFRRFTIGAFYWTSTVLRDDGVKLLMLPGFVSKLQLCHTCSGLNALSVVTSSRCFQFVCLFQYEHWTIDYRICGWFEVLPGSSNIILFLFCLCEISLHRDRRTDGQTDNAAHFIMPLLYGAGCITM